MIWWTKSFVTNVSINGNELLVPNVGILDLDKHTLKQLLDSSWWFNPLKFVDKIVDNYSLVFNNDFFQVIVLFCYDLLNRLFFLTKKKVNLDFQQINFLSHDLRRHLILIHLKYEIICHKKGIKLQKFNTIVSRSWIELRKFLFC